MLKYKEYILEKAVQNLDYLNAAYCKETEAMSLDDLLQKHHEYIFNIVRVIRRALETQLLQVNKDGISVFSSCVSLLQLLLQYNKQLNDIKTAEELKHISDTLIKDYKQYSAILEDALKNEWYPLDKDLSAYEQTHMDMEFFGAVVQQHLSLTGHHVNTYFPYLDEELIWCRRFGYFLQKFKNPASLYIYGFGCKDIDTSIFSPEKYIYGTRDRINIKAKQFDLVAMSRHAAFEGVRPKIMTALNYCKTSGSVCVFGYSTDFELLDLRRLASNLEHIHVYFFSYKGSPIVDDKLYCAVFGSVTDSKNGLKELPDLLNKFIEHKSDEELYYKVLGSSQDTQIVFQSYDMTPEEYKDLSKDINATTSIMLSTLFPKITTNIQQPLLPFNAGQLGLILISGEINGSIQEPDTQCCHVVKGSSTQTQSEPVIDEHYDEETHELISRTVSQITHATTTVNIVLPSGVIRTLQ